MASRRARAVPCPRPPLPFAAYSFLVWQDRAPGLLAGPAPRLMETTWHVKGGCRSSPNSSSPNSSFP